MYLDKVSVKQKRHSSGLLNAVQLNKENIKSNQFFFFFISVECWNSEKRLFGFLRNVICRYYILRWIKWWLVNKTAAIFKLLLFWLRILDDLAINWSINLINIKNKGNCNQTIPVLSTWNNKFMIKYVVFINKNHELTYL